MQGVQEKFGQILTKYLKLCIQPFIQVYNDFARITAILFGLKLKSYPSGTYLQIKEKNDTEKNDEQNMTRLKTT